MGKMNYLFDTNAILYELKGISKPIELKNTDSIFCSFVTKIELLSYTKMSEQEINTIKLLLSQLNVIYVDDDIIEKSISIKRKSKLKIPDEIICSSALNKKAALVTADKKLLKTAELMGIETRNALL
jgi:predicted nucleic acid-binding protein